MPPLQFQPYQSQPTPEFWSSLATLKLDTLGLDDSAIPISATVEDGREITSDINSNAEGGRTSIGVDGSVHLSSDAFLDSRSESRGGPLPGRQLKGLFKNFNTVEAFRSPTAKKALFDSVVDQMEQSFDSDEPMLDTFILFAFADLKKYVYHYWFAFPALVSKPPWELSSPMIPADPEVAYSRLKQLTMQDVKEAQTLLSAGDYLLGACLLSGRSGQRHAAKISDAATFFNGVPTEERTVVFRDSSALPHNPGWALRNILHYLHVKHNIQQVTVICLRQGDASRTATVFTTGATDGNPRMRPQAVGWERDGVGKLASKVANLGSMLDPLRLAEQAVDLNLKLMRWRVLPELDLERISSTRCLLLGAGTLGCYVARLLMGWGVRNITFVDSSRVSFSNPVRQPLFLYEDCLDGGKEKAPCAAERLKQVFPSVNAAGHSLMIPMPGHPVDPAGERAVCDTIARLESLITAHDAVFLLMDSRESRWLPTVIGSSQNKIVINAALGFDSYLVMRHGAGPSIPSVTPRLGCYFCNDIVAPADSLTDRTLDQMCTVTRPGIAPIAAATAVEMLASLVQHPEGVSAPSPTLKEVKATPGSPLGPIPHQLRGALGQWSSTAVLGHAFDSCTGCSEKVVHAYRKGGAAFLLRVFNDHGYLESVTGLDKLYAEAEAALESVEWEESDEDSM